MMGGSGKRHRLCHNSAGRGHAPALRPPTRVFGLQALERVPLMPGPDVGSHYAEGLGTDRCQGGSYRHENPAISPVTPNKPIRRARLKQLASSDISARTPDRPRNRK